MPRGRPIPYYVSMACFSPSVKASSSEGPPLPALPSPSSLTMVLTRHVFTRARRASQTVTQKVGTIADFDGERRVWYGDVQPVTSPNGETRMAREITMVGEAVFGGGPTLAAGPSFGTESTRGLLACSVSNPSNLPLPSLSQGN